MQQKNRCIFCMKEIPEGEKKCPHCHKGMWQYQWNPTWLKPYTVLASRYLIGQVLGEGGFGATYLAFDQEMKEVVAIKEECAQMQEESKVSSDEENQAEDHLIVIAGKLMELQDKFDLSTAVAQVKDAFLQNGKAYMVMEYLPGETLKKKMEREGHIQQDEVLLLVRPVIDALLILHSQGMLHCDISPDNLMFDEKQQLKLIDFGSVEFVKEDSVGVAKEKSVGVASQTESEDAKQSDRSEAKLKAGYAPLEQYQDQEKQGPWSDLYAMCAVLYVMLADKKVPATPDRVVQDNLRPIHEFAAVDSTLEQAIMRGLSMEVQKRFFSMDNFLQAAAIWKEESQKKEMQQETDQKDIEQKDIEQKDVEQKDTNQKETDQKDIEQNMRRYWGMLWISITTRVEQEETFAHRKRISVKMLGKALAVMAGVALLTGGIYMGGRHYIDTHKEIIFDYKLRQAMQKYPDNSEPSGVDQSEPEFEDALSFVRTNGKQNDDYTFYEYYALSKKTMKQWNRSWGDAFYLDLDTVQELLEYELKLQNGESSDTFTGAAFIYQDDEEEDYMVNVTAEVSRTIHYRGLSSWGNITYASIDADYISGRVKKITMDGSREEIKAVMEKVLPYLAPEVSLSAENIEDLVVSAEAYKDRTNYNVRLNAKCEIAIFPPTSDHKYTVWLEAT